MRLSEDLEFYADGMSRDAINERIYNPGDVNAVVGYISRKAIHATLLEAENARLLAVARAADAYLLAHEGWMSRGKWDRAMLLGEDLQTALAAVEDLL